MRHRHGCCHEHNEPQTATPHCPHRTCPLSRAPDSRRLRICRVGGDRRFCARMAALGMLPGRELELLRGGDHCLVRLDGGTVSLDHGVSEHILVTSD
ncbi:MAG: hypothetical protein BWK76_12795 [Desulfobulbaceae bacterium A2]|nr:MAG: hypothetical protein BWK76_12795 [Desulfobulbaceae bacterium A2]